MHSNHKSNTIKNEAIFNDNVSNAKYKNFRGKKYLNIYTKIYDLFEEIKYLILNVLIRIYYCL